MKAVLRVLGVASAIAVAACAGAAQTANAGLLSCVDNTERPFQAWGDNSPYTLAPNGGFESGATGWTLSGARIVTENNSFGRGRYSLSLPSGSSATSPTACVKALDPSSRFFVRNTGAADGKLKVELRYRTLLGLFYSTSTLGYATAGSNWQPSPKFSHLLDNILGTLALNGNLGANVQFRFTPVGRGASFLVDDLFVDPLLTI